VGHAQTLPPRREVFKSACPAGREQAPAPRGHEQCTGPDGLHLKMHHTIRTQTCRRLQRNVLLATWVVKAPCPDQCTLSSQKAPRKSHPVPTCLAKTIGGTCTLVTRTGSEQLLISMPCAATDKREKEQRKREKGCTQSGRRRAVPTPATPATKRPVVQMIKDSENTCTANLALPTAAMNNP